MEHTTAPLAEDAEAWWSPASSVCFSGGRGHSLLMLGPVRASAAAMHF